MRIFYFEKYFTLINAVTQSCPTDSSITIYEAESGVISASIYKSESCVISALRSTRQNLVWFLTPTRYHIEMFLVSSILASWIEMILGFCSRIKLEFLLRLITFGKKPTDLNPSERRQAACCGRGLKDAPSANFDHARRKIQRLKKIHQNDWGCRGHARKWRNCGVYILRKNLRRRGQARRCLIWFDLLLLLETVV